MVEISTILGNASTTETTKRVTRIDISESQIEGLVLQAIHQQNPGLASVGTVKIEVDFHCRHDVFAGAQVVISQETVDQSNS